MSDFFRRSVYVSMSFPLTTLHALRCFICLVRIFCDMLHTADFTRLCKWNVYVT